MRARPDVRCRTPGVLSIACRHVDRPIGMFDSGFGGLTVARALIDLLPGEDLVYIGDTGRYPYGPAGSRGARLRPPDRLAAGRRLRRQGRRRRLQHRRRRRARRAGRARCPCPCSASIEPGARALVRDHGDRPRRRDRHGRHDRVGRVRRGRSPAPAAPVDLLVRRVPRLRRVRRAGRDRRRPGERARRAAAGADARGRRRRAPARLHALPVPGPHDRRRDGPRRRARQLGRRDRVRRLGRCSRAGLLRRGVGSRPAGTASCRRATSSWFARARPPAARPRARPPPSAGRSNVEPRRTSTWRSHDRPDGRAADNCARSRSCATSPSSPPGRCW